MDIEEENVRRSPQLPERLLDGAVDLFARVPLGPVDEKAQSVREAGIVFDERDFDHRRKTTSIASRR